MQMLQFDWSFLVGYDFFISYRRSDASPYALGLARLLRRADFRCFLDDNEAVPGRPLTDRLRKALLRSKMLVVVASPDLDQSPWVPQEIEIFDSTGRDIIPINVQSGLLKAFQGDARFELLRTRDALWIDEREEIGPGSEPSSHVIGKLQKSFHYQKANRRLRLMIGAASLILLLLTFGFAFQWHRTRAELIRNIAVRLVTESQAMLDHSRTEGDERAILQLLAANSLSDDSQVHSGLLTAVLERERLRKLIATRSQLRYVAPCPDANRIVAGGWDSRMRGWTPTENSVVVQPFSTGSTGVVNIVFDPKHGLLVSGGSDGNIRIWDPFTTTLLESWPYNGRGLRAIAMSVATGAIATGTQDGTVTLRQAPRGTNSFAKSLPGAGGAILAVSFSSDGKYIFASTERNTIVQWDAQTGERVGEPMRAITNDVMSLGVSGGRIVCGCWNGSLQFLDLEAREPLVRLQAHSGPVNCLAFSHDGERMVTGSSDYTLRIWELRTGRPASEPLLGHVGAVTSAAFDANDTHVISCGEDGTLRVWDTKERGILGTPVRLGKAIHCVVFSPDGTKLLSGREDGTLELWDVASERLFVPQMVGHLKSITTAAFSPNGSRIVSASTDNSLRVWDSTTGKQVGEPLIGHTRAVTCLTFASDGHTVISGGADKSLRVWNVVEGKQLRGPLLGHSSEILAVALGSTGATVWSCGDDAQVIQWDLLTGKQRRHSIKGPVGPLENASFGRNGRLIISSSVDHELQVWDPGTGRAITPRLTGHRLKVFGLGFSPDDKYIISCGNDRIEGDYLLRLWDATSGQPVGPRFPSSTRYYMSAAFSPDGLKIATGSQDGIVRMWPGPKSWATELRSKLTRKMTPTEWNGWVSPTIPFRNLEAATSLN